ncbi:MAG: pantoate--beta-alanine ligase [Phycisphaerae bacterium]
MKTFTDTDQLREFVGRARRQGKCVGLVPTMGALHQGHLSLIDRAREQCDVVIATIFVNPTQFAPGEDLAAYPRTPQEDSAACESRGVDALFMPPVEVMYPLEGSRTTVHVSELTEVLCGARRPGHFDGVCLIVSKLFNLAQPDRAYFGEKDYQQLTVIRRMVSDLNFPIEIVGCPIVREPDGLAMSSRNAYLQPEQRVQAPELHASLTMAEEMIAERHPPAGQVVEAIRSYLQTRAPLGDIDYVKIANPRTLQDVQSTDQPVLVALAVRFGRARLIDNIVVDSPVGNP